MPTTRYACAINNLHGVSDRDGQLYISRPRFDSRGIYLSYLRNSRSANYTHSFTNPRAASNRIAGFITTPNSTVTTFNAIGQVVATLQDGSTIRHGGGGSLFLNNVVSPVTDYYYTITGIIIQYRISILDGVHNEYTNARINFTNPIRFRTVSEFNTAITAAGFSEFTVTGTSIENATPEIICEPYPSGTVTSITVTTLPSPTTGMTTVTIIDGDPPERTNSNAAHYVQTTIPTDTEVGDLWFNPSNNQLHIYTEDD